MYRRGGVCIVVRTSLNTEEISCSAWIEEKVFETCAVSCDLSAKKSVNILSVCKVLLKNMALVLDNVYKQDCNIVVAGDVNVDMLSKSNSKECKLLINLFKEYGIDNLIREPTRLTSHSKTSIDNIFTNYANGVSKVVETEKSDHTYQLARFNTRVTFDARKVVSFRSFSDRNVVNLGST